MDERDRLVATGFALGTLVGGAVVAMLSSRHKEAIAEQSRRKLEELTAGRSIEEVGQAVRGEIRKVAEEVDDSSNLLTEGR